MHENWRLTERYKFAAGLRGFDAGAIPTGAGLLVQLFLQLDAKRKRDTSRRPVSVRLAYSCAVPKRLKILQNCFSAM